ncbi:STAS-like domain-containing protein [Gilliamella sp. Occ4-3]|uniref:STAS-like domain-containing protein n=1 Tax=Gilliamella sp. Occ4-3 TaxID=3120254 RepID=UPI00080E425A|nr:STAS-like domain-containing protein [Gilliamella apicola]OCG76746.1 hypothetical protein A9G44_00345 [Gilliamella apicola]
MSINSSKIISVVKDFSTSPYGRDDTDDKENNGKLFRENYLVPALKQYDNVIVDLNGYNRYGRSFLDEAFAGLIRDEGFSYDELKTKLKIKHDTNHIFLKIIDERMISSQKFKETKNG